MKISSRSRRSEERFVVGRLGLAVLLVPGGLAVHLVAVAGGGLAVHLRLAADRLAV